MIGDQQSREIALLTSVDQFYRRLYLLDEYSESDSQPMPDPIKRGRKIFCVYGENLL